VKTQILALAASVLAAGGISVAAVPAQAAAPATTATTATILLNGAMRTLPIDIARKIKAGRPETLTPTETQVLTSTVPSSEPDGPTLSRSVPLGSPTGIRPLDVSRCSGSVCIAVKSKGGSGPFITQWNASWTGALSYACFTVYDWYANDEVFVTASGGCGEGNVYQTWYPNYSFPTGGAETYFVGTYPVGQSPIVQFSIT
jgi:hypothetical protein